MDCFATVQPGDIAYTCSETWLTHQNRLDSSNKGASHAVARGVCRGPAKRVCDAYQARGSEPSATVPAVRDQCPDWLQVDRALRCGGYDAGRPLASTAPQPGSHCSCDSAADRGFARCPSGLG